MRVCLLTTQDLDADPFPSDDWPCDPRPYLPEAKWHVEPLEKRNSEEVVARLAIAGEFDLFFNLCTFFDESTLRGGMWGWVGCWWRGYHASHPAPKSRYCFGNLD